MKIRLFGSIWVTEISFGRYLRVVPTNCHTEVRMQGGVSLSFCMEALSLFLSIGSDELQCILIDLLQVSEYRISEF